MELYVHTGGENDERVFLCRPGIDNNVAECFETQGVPAHEAADKIARAVNVAQYIAEILDNSPEWDSGTMSDVANALAEAGYKIRSTEEQLAAEEGEDGK